jgi:hypothetical protein
MGYPVNEDVYKKLIAQMPVSELQKKLNCSKSAIYYWRDVTRGISLERAFQVSRLSGIPVSEIIGVDLES